MASKTFNLSDGSCETKSLSSGAKLCIIVVVLAVALAIVGVGFFVYKTNFGSSAAAGEGGLPPCSVPPLLDENGLSNWTNGAEVLAYACFPGFYLEGHDNVLIALCENGTWSRRPPACNSLPLRLDCQVDHLGLQGNISMWQASLSEPAFISGLIRYGGVDRSSSSHLSLSLVMSKSSCNVSSDEGDPALSEGEEEMKDSLRISFNSTDLKAYNKAEVHVNLIFVSPNTTASLVSVHQDERTFVLSNSLSLTRLSRDSSKDLFQDYVWNS